MISPRSVTSAVPAAASPASSLDEEVLAIDRARRSLTAGDAPSALERVDAYDARYPNGALAQESAEIRIEALFRVGKRAPAERLAERFLAAHPTSPYARVIRALLAGAAPPSP
jgi:outer membrane protein assembly factor BamD (BamD/ComL family)